MPEQPISVNAGVTNPQDVPAESSPPKGAETPSTNLDATGVKQEPEQMIPKSRFDEVLGNYNKVKALVERYDLVKQSAPEVAAQFPTPEAFYDYALRRAIQADMEIQNQAAQKQPAAKVEEPVKETGEEVEPEDKVSKLEKDYENLRMEIQAAKEQKVVNDCATAFQQTCNERGVPAEAVNTLFPLVYESFSAAFYRNNPDIKNPTWYPSPQDVATFTKGLLDNFSKLNFASPPKTVAKPSAPPIPAATGKLPPPTRVNTKESRIEAISKALKF